jgi:hypothetical protein
MLHTVCYIQYVCDSRSTLIQRISCAVAGASNAFLVFLSRFTDQIDPSIDGSAFGRDDVLVVVNIGELSHCSIGALSSLKRGTFGLFFIIAAAAALDAAVPQGLRIRFLPDVILDDADGVDGDADADVDASNCATKLSQCCRNAVNARLAEDVAAAAFGDFLSYCW